MCSSCVSRALKKKGNTPKYGLIFHSSFIGRAASQNKGRISRYLANKCSIASRIDCFSGKVCGDVLMPIYLINLGNIFLQFS
jgi:RNA processing factor Prp31